MVIRYVEIIYYAVDDLDYVLSALRPFTVFHDSNNPLEDFPPYAISSYTTAKPFTLLCSLPSISSSPEAAVLAGS
jgi:hypothetical protein